MKEPQHDNMFEDILKKKADGFEPEPSDAVWQKVNRGIARNRRRRFLLWIFSVFLIAGLLSGSYFFFRGEKTNSSPIVSTTSAHQPLPSRVTKPTETQKTIINNPIPDNAAFNNATGDKKTEIINPSITVSPKIKVNSEINPVEKAPAVVAVETNQAEIISLTEPENTNPENNLSTYEAEPKTAEVVIENTIPPSNQTLLLPGITDTVKPTTLPLTVVDSTSVKKNNHKWSIGISGSIDNSYRRLVSDDDSLKELRDKEEIPITGYHAGIAFCYTFNKRLSLQTGLTFTMKGEKTNPQRIIIVIPPGPVVPSGYGGVATNPDSIKYSDSSIAYKYSYYYLEIPLLLQYQFGQKKLCGIVSAGIAPGALVKHEEAPYIYYNKTVTKNPPSPPVTISLRTACHLIINIRVPRIYQAKAALQFISALSLDLVLSAGLEYNFSKKFFVQVAPVFHYGLIPTTKGTTEKEHLYSTGISAGLFLKL